MEHSPHLRVEIAIRLIQRLTQALRGYVEDQTYDVSDLGEYDGTEAASGGRIIGLDIAHAFAIIGMVIVNYKVTMGAESTEPQWLRAVTAMFDGRAAATFVILAGIGASLGSRRARTGGNPVEQRAAQLTLAKRALFLFVLGWIFYPIWPANILHFYGLYLAIGAIAAPVPVIILTVVSLVRDASITEATL